MRRFCNAWKHHYIVSTYSEKALPHNRQINIRLEKNSFRNLIPGHRREAQLITHWPHKVTRSLTGPFHKFTSSNSVYRQIYEVRKRLLTDFEALKWRKDLSGAVSFPPLSLSDAQENFLFCRSAKSSLWSQAVIKKRWGSFTRPTFLSKILFWTFQVWNVLHGLCSEYLSHLCKRNE